MLDMGTRRGSLTDAMKLSQDAHFTNDLGLDSLDTVEVVMAIEEVQLHGGGGTTEPTLTVVYRSSASRFPTRRRMRSKVVCFGTRWTFAADADVAQ